jgi:hypothetical protein
LKLSFKEGEIKMKKLLVLLMVLGLVSSAQAALSLSLDGNPAPDAITISVSTTVLIDVHSDTQEFWDGLLMIVDDGATPGDTSLYGEWVPPMVASGIGNTGQYSEVTPEIWEMHVSSSIAPYPGDVVAGQQFTIGFHCKAIGDLTIYLTDYDMVTIDTIAVHQVIPEPMTIGLLGLGGLFLRRRR